MRWDYFQIIDLYVSFLLFYKHEWNIISSVNNLNDFIEENLHGKKSSSENPFSPSLWVFLFENQSKLNWEFIRNNQKYSFESLENETDVIMLDFALLCEWVQSEHIFKISN